MCLCACVCVRVHCTMRGHMECFSIPHKQTFIDTNLANLSFFSCLDIFAFSFFCIFLSFSILINAKKKQLLIIRFFSLSFFWSQCVLLLCLLMRNYLTELELNTQCVVDMEDQQTILRNAASIEKPDR